MCDPWLPNLDEYLHMHVCVSARDTGQILDAARDMSVEDLHQETAQRKTQARTRPPARPLARARARALTHATYV